MPKTRFGLITLALACLMASAAAAADGVEEIKKRGTLIVGVKADYRPFGFRDPTGAIVGIEPGCGPCPGPGA